MKKRILTISREFGSGGRFIGKEVAARLGISFYDRELIGKVMAETGFSRDFIENSGEYANGKSIFSYSFSPRDINGMSAEDYLFRAQQKVILEIAETEPCVIVGRCADYFLRDRDDVLDAFIFGNTKEKQARIMRLYSRNEKEALFLMKDVDKKRAINYQYCTDRKWGELRNYDVALNTSRLGYDKCIDILAEMMA